MAKTKTKASKQRRVDPETVAPLDAPSPPPVPASSPVSESVPPGRPPEDLPVDPHRFWTVGESWESLTRPPEAEVKAALELLGPLPIPRGGFPLMGFLATIYDHVAAAIQAGPDIPRDGSQTG